MYSRVESSDQIVPYIHSLLEEDMFDSIRELNASIYLKDLLKNGLYSISSKANQLVFHEIPIPSTSGTYHQNTEPMTCTTPATINPNVMPTARSMPSVIVENPNRKVALKEPDIRKAHRALNGWKHPGSKPLNKSSESLDQMKTDDVFKNSPDQSNSRKRKSVKFADDHGEPLGTVMEYENPLYKEISSHLVPHWKLTFEQPLNDYAQFNQKILDGMISLENAFVMEESWILYGTIAAINLAKEKLVYVSYTTNGWKTHTDVIANLLSASMVFDIYYFAFEIPKPSTETNCIEFAIFYEVDEKRIFYDNNDGKNYSMMLEMKAQEPHFRKVNRKHKKKKKHHHNSYVVNCLDEINEAWKRL